MLLAVIFATAPVVAAAQPNVLVLMTDDQSADSMWAMPWTRELIGAEGVTFTNSFVSYPRCCPSRATFFTGQYAHNHGVLSNTLPFGSYDRLDTSSWLPGWLQVRRCRGDLPFQLPCAEALHGPAARRSADCLLPGRRRERRRCCRARCLRGCYWSC
jgi:hypothetical protein